MNDPTTTLPGAIAQAPLQFGPGDALMGMLTLPARPARGGTACLMFNMGANHRVGPRRINVKLAHLLAARGVGSLRFDLGGIGDSDALATSPDLHVRAVHSLKAAMDAAQRTLGVNQFVIVGMCSGVEHAMSAALADRRVVGLSLFDGFAFPELRARLERNLRRALAAPAHPSFPGKARRWLQRHFLRSHSTTPLPGFFAERRAPEANAIWFGAALQRLAECNVAMQLLYSGSLHVCDRGRDQLGAFARKPFAQGLQYEFLGEVDHTVCTARGQQLFLRSVGDWVAERCLAGGTERRSQGSSRAPASPEPAMTTWAAL